MKQAKKSTVVGMRLKSEQELRLKRLAKRLGRSISDAGALLVEEGLRRSDFAFIDFRESAVGREAFIQGRRLPVWQVIKLHRKLGENLEKTAEYLAWPPILVQAAINYYKAFSAEIKEAIDEAENTSIDSIARLLPQLEHITLE